MREYISNTGYNIKYEEYLSSVGNIYEAWGRSAVAAGEEARDADRVRV